MPVSRLSSGDAQPSGPTEAVVGGALDHVLQLYEDEQILCDTAANFVAEGLIAAQPLLVIATEAHGKELANRLVDKGFDLDALKGSGKLTIVDTREVCATFMAGALPDAELFKSHVGRLIERSLQARRSKTVRVYGEMVDVLWQDGNPEAAIRVEDLWNTLGASHSFSLFCAYAMANFYKEGHARLCREACYRHTSVIPPQADGEVENEPSRPRLTGRLQEHSLALETELKHHRQLERVLRSVLSAHERSDQQLKEFFENAPEGLHCVGLDGVIVWANRAELNLLGYSREEYVGHHIREFYVDEARVSEVLERFSRNETVRNYEVRLRCKDSSIRYVLITASALWENDAFVHARCFTRDITDSKLANEARAWLASIVDSSNDAIVGKTLDGIITSWNAGAERIFGYTAAEAIGQHITLVIPPERRAEEVEVLARLRRGERVRHFETVRSAKDGRAIDISLTISPIKNADGDIIGASKVARDITEQKRIELELHNASRMKDEFLATLSHELRTPLNAMLGWSQMLRSGVLQPDIQQRALDSLERNARAQAQLVEDLLDVSRIASGKLKVQADLVDLAHVVSAAVDTIGPSAAAKRVDIRINIKADADILVTGDADRLQQVVWNLLSNAIKFTPAGGRVDVELRQTDSKAEIIVRDTGRGIPPSLLPHVFDRFRQADSTAARAHGGLGLGLALVRYVTEAHGGTVDVESSGDGQGAAFSVRLPILALTARQLRNAMPMARGLPSIRTDARVLVVDDEVDAREVLRALLESYGARVSTAASAGEALHALGRQEFDVLLADIGMPQQDGYSLIRAIRALPAERGRRIPAVAVTAYVSMRERDRVLKAGYNSHIGKPVELDHLIEIIVGLTGHQAPRDSAGT